MHHALNLIRRTAKHTKFFNALKNVIPVLVLILLVLGSIFTGFATPTESSAVGCFGAVILALLFRTFSWKLIYKSLQESVKISSMVFAILIGATAFSMIFSYTGADTIVEDFMMSLPGQKWGFIALTMVSILILGFLLIMLKFHI